MPDKSKSNESNRLPFEPKKANKLEKKAAPAPKAPSASKKVAVSPVKSSAPLESSAIPEAVSRRMIKRMLVFCGIPSLLGISTFIVSYLLVSNDIVALPNYAVVLVSMGFLGLGVVGLSYGVLSASWDEDAPGSPLGLSEFSVNFDRMTSAWRSQKKS
jgi:Photosynthesis affected mutant 68